jgi:hypothetical protein
LRPAALAVLALLVTLITFRQSGNAELAPATLIHQLPHEGLYLMTTIFDPIKLGDIELPTASSWRR